jgi:hypothetical protein
VKGVELPINILVIVAIAVIVLLGLVALYFIGFNPLSVSISQDSAKSNACRDYLHQYPVCSNAGDNADAVTSCSLGVVCLNYPASTLRTLQNFTNQYYGCGADDQDCTRRVCGCPGY